MSAIRYKIVEQVISAHNNELEDVLAGLIINGVATSRIMLHYFTSNPQLTKVLVDGELKYTLRTAIRPAFDVESGKLKYIITSQLEKAG